MSDTTQIAGIAVIFFFMAMSLYGIVVKNEFKKPIWLMTVALLVGMVIF